MVGTVGTVGTLGHTFRHSKGAVTGSVISGWDIWDTWDRGPQPLIYFTTSDMVVGETITIDHLVSVYQGDANAVFSLPHSATVEISRIPGRLPPSACWDLQTYLLHVFYSIQRRSAHDFPSPVKSGLPSPPTVLTSAAATPQGPWSPAISLKLHSPQPASLAPANGLSESSLR